MFFVWFWYVLWGRVCVCVGLWVWCVQHGYDHHLDGDNLTYDTGRTHTHTQTRTPHANITHAHKSTPTKHAHVRPHTVRPEWGCAVECAGCALWCVRSLQLMVWVRVVWVVVHVVVVVVCVCVCVCVCECECECVCMRVYM